MKAIYYGDTNIGNIRLRNEDAFVIKEVWGGSHILAIVADGVGGNGGGDIAANLACKCITDYFNDLSIIMDGSATLIDAVRFANNMIYSGHYIPYLSHMSCVLTAALINLETGKMDVCHVGDTRLYTLEKGVFSKVTSDHSLVGPLEESRQITEREAMKHPRHNIITRSIGNDILVDGTEYIQAHTINLKPCTLLLCSDGLYDMVYSSQIVKILSDPVSVDKRVEKLIGTALYAGGKDNVTVIIIDLMK